MPNEEQPLTFCEWQLLRYLARLGYDPQPKRRCYSSGIPEPELSFVVYREDALMRQVRRHLTSLRYGSDGLSVHADRAALSLIERGYVGEPDQHGNRRLTDAGRKAAQQPPPERTAAPPPPLHDGDFEVLRELTTRWLTPYEFGGRSGSRHSASALRLVHHGYAATKQRGAPESSAIIGKSTTLSSIFKQRKGSRVYRITTAGERALAQWRERKRSQN